MTVAARKLLDAFEALAPPEKQEVAAEILRRSAGIEFVPDASLEEMAAEVFGVYEAEESTGAPREAR